MSPFIKFFTFLIKLSTSHKKKLHLLSKKLQLSSNKSDIFSETDIKQIGDLETVLINSDFDIHHEIDRENLHRTIIENGYLSSYEPCNYPGVNIKYYFNPCKRNFGICDCEKPCNGKGLNDTCKKITIAVFKSGKIIITGGRNKHHIQTAYEFITEFIDENKDFVLKKD